MMNFRPLLFTLATSTCFSEVITLSTGTQFEGELLSISPEGGVLVESSRTPEPLALKLDSFSQLEMEGPVEADPFQTERLVLANGDILPGNLHSFDSDKIVYEGLAGGRLTLTRNQVTTLRFGIKPQSLQYEGPTPLTGWSGTGTTVWTASKEPADGLTMLEPGKMERDVNLGSQFILKFDLKWQETPAIRIYFGSEPSSVSKQDRYYVELNSGGIQLKRQRSIDPQWHSLLSPLGKLEAFDDNHVNVELRVNRLIGTIDLYLDGELIRQMLDSSPPTKGNFLVIERSRSDNSTSYLSNLKVFSWDAVSQIELMEEPGDGEADSLVDVEGKRISGQLMGLFPQENQEEEVTEKKTPPSYFMLQSPFAEEPVQIPTEKTRIIYFQTTIKNAPPSVFPKYELDLANDGIISATSLSMNNDQITLEHPLLGSLNIARAAVKQIRYLKELTNEEE